ncbi:MAG: hypothetical protein IPM53_30100 [Anaerolineaceae bacterium]|nr:hypothetical protein [Anaerolineaceae bacterium]
MILNENNPQSATLKILYSEYPDSNNGRFLEIRKWETPCGDHCELIVESGEINSDGELVTVSQVLPFFLTVAQIFQGRDQ